MFRIMMDNEVFFDPRLDSYPLKAPKLIREANKIGTLTFTVFPPHPAYGNIKTRKTRFTVQQDGTPIFTGRPLYSRRTFKNGMEYKCEEVTGVMNDFMFRPAAFSGDAGQLFLNILSSFNNRSRDVQVNPGNVMNPGAMEWGADRGYMGHWDALQELVSAYGGYMIPRYEGGQLLIDWLYEDDLPEAQQKIRFGENMKDMFIETDAIESYSGVIPIGGVPSGGTAKIDITSVNDGSDVIYNEDAVELYGVREIVKEWETITDPAALKSAGNEWIRGSAVQFRKTVQLKAVDLHNLNMAIEAFPFMYWITAESTKHDLSARYILSREETPLDKPVGLEFTLGDTRRTFSESVSKGG